VPPRLVVDSSAVLAVLFTEPDESRFVAALEGSREILLSAATLVELSAVALGRLGETDRLDRLLRTSAARVVALDEHQALAAREAFRRYGKGRHRAGLNLGDCFAYALAKTRDLPLLFKGDDLAHTDVRSAL
jgi:ribonuclease VapC